MKQNKIEIPIYRAKKIDSDEYVIGYFYQPTYFIIDGGKIICHRTYETFSIDVTTLAIHFNDMTDSQVNKIFASLSEDGKGGDILEWTIFQDDMPKLRINGVPYYSKGVAFKVTGRIEMMWHLLEPHRECKIIGIQE